MDDIIPKLRKLIKGEVTNDLSVRHDNSHDASVYELLPEAVIRPIDSTDIEKLVKFVSKNKSSYPKLAITPRSAGTDMSGGAIGSSLLLDMTTHFNKIESLQGTLLKTQPGVYMRAIDPLLYDKSLHLGCVPASRAINTIGGMVGNNSGGERSLQYGNTERWVRELKVVFADGNEYTVKPLNRKQLEQKLKETTYEASLYRQTYELIEKNYDLIKNARPHVNKNSMGYNLWSVWDRDTGIFDMTRLITGSQGTLGIITDITIEAVPKAPYSGLLLAYLPSIKNLGDVIATVMHHEPATFEGFDNITFNLGLRYFNTFRKQLGTKEWLRQQAVLLKSVAKFKGHIPSMFLMIEFDGQTKGEVLDKISILHDDLKSFKIEMDIQADEAASAPFWKIRRAALSLLQNQVHGRYASPFIDDMAVPPRYLPEFVPKLRKVIRKYKLPATIQGHFGDGNFHVIPLMDIAGPKDRAKLEPVMRELIPVVLKYGGTMAGEHNDGMVRGPWLPAVFGQPVYEIFKETKEIFDPLYIFNPHKKTDASWEYSMSHIRSANDEG
ncbi:MAG: putative oxidoreductase [Candidatus Saccharibacteria bacterium]|nr:putative oxidoreductase [Candidatus Saccharibacteria bacterium]MDB5180677.1 putative oxidoreductase [Candidatus Saccharibacteria bacterium]